jgi:large subunit ribosomal protein L10
MTREEKSIAIEDLTAQLAGTNIIYVSDIWIKCRDTSNLRRAYKGIKLEVVKILCLQKQWKFHNDYGDLPSVLTGNSAIFISDVAMPWKNQRFQKKSANLLY